MAAFQPSSATAPAAERRGTALRRQRILAAARFLFLRDGLRGTTMAAIAREAGVAKPTLYSYFADKETVFTAVVAGFMDELKVLVTAALAGSGTPSARIAAAFRVKFGAISELIDESPHAEEIYGAHTRLSGHEVAAINAWMVGTLASFLEREGFDRAGELAAILVAAVDGVRDQGWPAGQRDAAIDLLVGSLLGS